MVDRRPAGLPLEHVLGWAEFCGLRIAVDPGVFVPRRRTELLVCQAAAVAPQGAGPADLAASQAIVEPRVVFVDLCCGSGAVGAALAVALDRVALYAVDIDPVAGGQVFEGDLYEPLPAALWGRVDILVANAGVTKDNLVVQLKDEDWDQVIAINLTATVRLTRAAVKTMMRRRFGRIIGITSVVGVTGNAGQSNYTASKAGLVGMIKSVAAEYARRSVTANAIAPGLIATAMTDKLNPNQRETILARVPAARLGTAADVAAAAVYLASDEAGYVTGQTIHVNGGMAMI